VVTMRRDRSTAVRALIAIGALAAVGLSGCPEEPCGAGEVLDGESCVPQECGVGPWGNEDLPDALHVALWGDEGGDGSAEAPLVSLSDSLDRLAGSGGTLVLAAGVWEGDWELPETENGILLAGRCAAMTTLLGDDDEPTVLITGATAELRGVTVSRGKPAVELAPGVGSEDAPIRLTDLVIEDATHWGISVLDDAHAVLERVTVVRTIPNDQMYEPAWGIGLWVSNAFVELRSGRFEEQRDGIEIDGGRLLAIDVECRETRCLAGGGLGVEVEVDGLTSVGGSGVHIYDGSLIGRDLRIEGARNAITGDGQMDISDVVVRDSHLGLWPGWGGVATVRDVLIEDCDTGVFVNGGGTFLEMEDVTIRGIGKLDGAGYGIQAMFTAELIGERVTIEDVHGYGIWGFAVAPRVELIDSTIRGVTAVRAGGGAGVFSQGINTTIVLEGVTIEDTEGPGLLADVGGAVEADGLLIERAGFAGAVSLSARLDLSDLTVRETLPATGNGGGFGVFSWDDSEHTDPDVLLDGFDLSDQRFGGIYLRGPGRYEFRSGVVHDGGMGPLPGGLFAVGGVEAWTGGPEPTGLLVQDVRFERLARDGVLLDGSSAVLEDLSFDELSGEPLWWQRCDGVEPPTVTGSGAVDGDCREFHRETAPLIDYTLVLDEVDVAP
jgi:hypothetical protein